jgi:hypothetical protein
MSGRFNDKVALITGAGSGIGRAVVLRLVDEGASVFAVDINKGRLDETQGMASGDVVTHQADLSDPDACVGAVAACVGGLGRVDVLGNIAGIYLAEHATKVTREQYRRVMAVNLDACFFLAQAAIPYLLEAGGNIVNIASNAGLQGVPYSTVYCMSKGSVCPIGTPPGTRGSDQLRPWSRCPSLDVHQTPFPAHARTCTSASSRGNPTHGNGPLSNLIHIPHEAINMHSERVRKSLAVHEGFRRGPADLE